MPLLRSNLVPVAVALMGVACGSTGDGNRDGSVTDATPAADTVGFVDAVWADAACEPTDIDLCCAGSPGATEADPMIEIGGDVRLTGGSEEGVSVSFRLNADNTVLAEDTTAANGTYLLSVPTGGVPVSGHLYAARSDLLSSLFYPARPVARNEVIDFPLFSESQLDAIATIAGTVRDPNLGALLVAVTDCSGKPLAGAEVRLLPESGEVFYLEGDTPNPLLESTTSSGLALVFNVAEGVVSLQASHAVAVLRDQESTSARGTIAIVVLAP